MLGYKEAHIQHWAFIHVNYYCLLWSWGCVDILENFRASQKKSQSVHYYCIIVRVLAPNVWQCDRPTHYPGGLAPLCLLLSRYWFSVCAGLASPLPTERPSSIGDNIWSDLKQELWATVNIGTGPSLGWPCSTECPDTRAARFKAHGITQNYWLRFP